MDLEIKNRIIERAVSLFSESGIKGITMDDLARYMGMSKRTIYEYFKDKEDLVNECVTYMERSQDQKTKKIFEESENMFEALMKMYQESLVKMQKINKKFIDDIQKYFPEIKRCHDRKKEEGLKKSIQFFQKGINEGLIRNELNPEILSVLISGEMELLFNGKIFLATKFSFFDIYKTLFITFLRGIATARGLAIIDGFLQKDAN